MTMRMMAPVARLATRLSLVLAAAATLWASPQRPSTAAALTLDAVLERARQYVAAYGADLALVVGIESYDQSVRSADVAGPATQGLRPWARKTVAEFAMVRTANDWIGYRDVVELDGKIVGDRRDRLEQLFLHSPASAASQARQIADESARYNAGSLQRNFNIPTMALLFLQPVHARRFKFKQDGTDKIDGTPVWKLKFEETGRPTIVRGRENSDVPVRGRFWVDPTDGRVLKSFMEITAEAQLGATTANRDPRVMGASDTSDLIVETFSRVTSTYRHEPRLNMLVPAEMTEDHQGLVFVAQVGQERLTSITCRAVYTGFKKFEATGRVILK